VQVLKLTPMGATLAVALSPCCYCPGSPPGSLSVDMTIRTQTPFSHISFKLEVALRAASYIVGATLAVNTFQLSQKGGKNTRSSVSDILRYENKKPVQKGTS